MKIQYPFYPVILSNSFFFGHGTIALDMGTREVDYTIQVVSEIINRRLAGEGIDWIDPYRFFWERELKKAEPIKIQYR